MRSCYLEDGDAWHDRVRSNMWCQFAGKRPSHDLQAAFCDGIRPGPICSAGLHGQRKIVHDRTVSGVLQMWNRVLSDQECAGQIGRHNLLP